MNKQEADSGRRRPRVPTVLLPVLMTVAMVLVAIFVLDDTGSSGRAGVKEQSLTVVGGIGSDEAARLTLAGMAAARPSLHLALGDLSYDGPGSETAWCDLVKQQLIAPVQIVAGDREEDLGEGGRIATFERCLPDRMKSRGLYGREYYFDLAGLARVILISPGLTIEGQQFTYGEGNANEQWLEAAIDGARDAKIPWVIVGMHKNCISVGEYYCNIHQDLFSRLIDKKVDLVLSGDDHTYQRSVQLRRGPAACPGGVADTFARGCDAPGDGDRQYRRGAGSVFVVSGAGGRDLPGLDDSDPKRGYFASIMGTDLPPRNGFLRIQVGENRLVGEFIGTTPGAFTDRFTIAAST